MAHPLQDVIRSAIVCALREYEGNVELAAQDLGIGRVTLYRKLQELEIAKSEYIGLPAEKRAKLDSSLRATLIHITRLALSLLDQDGDTKEAGDVSATGAALKWARQSAEGEPLTAEDAAADLAFKAAALAGPSFS